MYGQRRKGYWSGMPVDLKGRAIGWAIYYLIAIFIFTQNAILGIVLLVAPSLWYVVRNVVMGEFGGRLDVERKDTLSGYTVSFIWNSSIYARVAMIAVGAVVVLFGLGWISTEDFRAEAAKPPTVTERITDAAGSAYETTKAKTGELAQATKEKTGGWIEAAKGWFTSDDAE